MGFSETSLSVLLLFILFSSLYATSRITHHRHNPTSFSPNQRAEKLIRSLNLFPKNPVKMIHGHSVLDDFVPGKIVEKKFSFFGHSDGLSIDNLGHHAGYYSLPHSKAARMFYYFFKSRNNTNDDPVVIWLAGGPGCSGAIPLFYENGPFKIANNLSLVWNDYGWDKASNIIYIDQPIGTGFSYTSDDSDIRHDQTSISNDLYDFLQEFFKQHPEFVKNDFYITGESYAGHFAPALASRIRRGNKDKEGIIINLKGFAVGNGMTNPRIQYLAYPQYALDMKLIAKEDQDDINKLMPKCHDAIKTCEAGGKESCLLAFKQCEGVTNDILSIAGNINHYDIRKTCHGDLCYDFSNVMKLLNEKTVKDALGVGDIEFVSCSKIVYDALQQDWMKNHEVDIPSLLEEGIKVLIYVGEFDLLCNWLGNSNWVHAMEWSGRNQFVAAKTVPFLVDGAKAGLLNSYGPLSFLKVNDAGHMVPMDQPKAALQMLVNWMQGKLN
ncbi:putative carboxypeptidase C [Medicago truncatula]|uniref:Carboxypeptidase n=1 Tax=Medicago truncatula TaxID=3880 RepID=A0A072UJP4_MEDTR|nr:serine carboxypeptidase-like isoform X1 [Medicago truncatula]KEH29969.1 serine carboxypeptidase-like protein [Medicago truncatula]RHN60663.1 putative carboxypeptidase C [Medicago truncatula]